MYKIAIKNVSNTHEYEELIKIFLRPGEFEIADKDSGNLVFYGSDDKNRTKREIYHKLSALTGRRPEWGIITGIRPTKLFGDIKRKKGSNSSASKAMREKYLVSDAKINLIQNIYNYQLEAFGEARKNTAGIYIGIPFCPSRCLYCAFTSNNADEEGIKKYLTALYKEINAVADMMDAKGITAESIYIGGGTPTVLSENDLDELLALVNKRFLREETVEFTVEGGRPDTITPGKVRSIEKNGANRISINPQSMKDETIRLIGRNHTALEIVKAVNMTGEISSLAINMDIIAGLPGEDVSDFSNTIDQMLDLDVENITVHSLAVKRTSRLAEKDKEYHYLYGDLVRRMIDVAENKLGDAGYKPYYLYRQKHMSGALENVGYTKPGYSGLYNIRIMDEHQMIMALGAGGISKAYDFDNRTLTRIPNVSNYEVYIDRIDEMIDRKRAGMFEEESKC